MSGSLEIPTTKDFGSWTEELPATVAATAAEARSKAARPTDKRAIQFEKLRVLGQDVLDAIYDEHVFNADPRFKEIFEIVDGSAEPTKEQALFVANKLGEMGRADRIDYLTKAFSLPMNRIRAINKYLEYRDMLEDFS